jgi:hypothetical protein
MHCPKVGTRSLVLTTPRQSLGRAVPFLAMRSLLLGMRQVFGQHRFEQGATPHPFGAIRCPFEPMRNPFAAMRCEKGDASFRRRGRNLRGVPAQTEKPRQAQSRFALRASRSLAGVDRDHGGQSGSRGEWLLSLP